MAVPIFCVNEDGELCVCPDGGGTGGGESWISISRLPCVECPDFSAAINVTISGLSGYLAKYNGAYGDIGSSSVDCEFYKPFAYYSGETLYELIEISVLYSGIGPSGTLLFKFTEIDTGGSMYATLSLSSAGECVIAGAFAYVSCTLDASPPTRTDCDDMLGIAAVVSEIQ
jgi:hypothetical protein